MSVWRREIPVPVAGPALRWALFAGILAAGAALRFAGLGDESLWYDESWSWWLASGDLLEKLRTKDAHPPLYYATLALWIRGGDGEAWMRALSALYGTLTLPLFYRLGQRVGRVGLLAMAFLAFCPYHVRFSQEARSYVLLFLEAAVLLNLLADLRETGSAAKWAGIAVATAAMMYTHYMAAFFLAGVAIACAFWARERPGFGKGALAALAGAVVLFLPWLRTAIDHTLLIQRGFWIPFPTARVVGYSLGQLAISPVPFGEPRHYAWAAAMFLLALGAPWIARDRKLAVWILPLVVPIAGEWAASLRQPIFYTRTFMYVLLPFLLLLAVAVARLPRWAKAGAAFLVLAAMVPGLVAVRMTVHKEDWRGCAALAGRALPGEAVVVHPWYLKRNLEYSWRRGGGPPLWTIETSQRTWIESAGREATAMEQVAERARREGTSGIWLIRRPYEGTDRQGIPPELDALFPRRFRYAARNTEILYWAR